MKKKSAEAGGKLGFLVGLLFEPQDGSDMFLQNIGLSPNYSATTQKIVIFIVTAM
jgi:hypothetical protein